MKRLVSFAIFLAVALFASAEARAFGLGFYLDGGAGFGNVSDASGGSRSHASTAFGGGLALDTSLAQDEMLGAMPREPRSYRLKVGYQRQDWDDGIQLNAATVDNILGFRIAAREAYRVWAGPLLRIQYVWGDEETETPYHGFAGRNKVTSTISAFGAGAGAAVGVNFTGIGVGLEAGFVYSLLFAGTIDGPGDLDRDMDGSDGQVYGSVVVMFR